MLFENGEFLPDQPDLGNPGSTVAKNVYPAPRGFLPFGSLTALGPAMATRPLGGTSETTLSGFSKVYAGTASKLYSLSNATTADLTRSNLILQSADISTTWTNTNSTDTTNGDTAPDGTTTADTLTEDATASDEHAIYQDVTITAAEYTLSVHVKEPSTNSRRYVTLEISDSTDAAKYGRATFDIQGGIISAGASSATFTGASATITALASGWYRISVTVTSTVTTGRMSLYLNDDGTDGGITYNGDGASKMIVWGFMLETGDTVGTYQGTTTTAAGAYSTGTFWDFDAYGDLIIGTNYVDNPQYADMSTGGRFADLMTDFKARTVATIRDFLVFGATTDSTDGAKPERIRWSALGDIKDYTISATTQSDFQDTPGGGAVKRIFGGEYGVALFDHAIYRINYVGSPNVFQFDEIETERGLYASGAAAQNGSIIYYLDSDGFYAFDGSRSQPIGNERVDRWFWSEFDATYQDRISCAIDHDRKSVCWSFPAQVNTSGKPNRILIFNFEVNRWSYAEIDHDMIIPLNSSAFTLEDLDNLYSDVEDAPVSMDARIYFEGSQVLGVFDSFTLNANVGEPLTAVIESMEKQPVADRRAHMTEVWPLNDGATTSVEVGVRNRQADSYSWSSPVTVNATGFCPVNAEGRYFRLRQTLTGNWTISQGANTKVKGRGRF